MIFMSQSGLLDPTRGPAWDLWYEDHLRLMRSVPGFLSAQRFKTSHPDHSPSLAMYTVTSEQVFSDPYYLSVRGMGEWGSLIDRRFYKRNLFDGLDTAPSVGADEIMLVADAETPEAKIVDLTWLHAVAIDRVPSYRGISVLKASECPPEDQLGALAVYRPVV